VSIVSAYILTPVCVAVIFAALSFIKNKPRDALGTFGYPKKIIRLVSFGLPALIVMGAIMIFVSPRSSWRHPAADAAFGGAVIGAYLLAYLHIKSFFVQLESGNLTWGSVFFRKTLSLSLIKRFALIQGGRGGQTLELRNAKNRIAFRVADTVQDFGELAADIRKQLPHDGVSFAYRNSWGKWSEKK
jgi:hypothetical protein